VLYLYAISGEADPPQGLDGLRGSSVETVSVGSLSAFVSSHDQIRVEANEDDLWGHEAVVEALMERSDVLPMRFGSMVADELALSGMLRDRQAEFETGLKRVRGAVELGVRALRSEIPVERPTAPTASSAEGASPGTAYMMARLEQERQSDDLERWVHAPLDALARASRRSPALQGKPFLHVSYLVERDAVETFRLRVEELESELGRVQILCTGPWPPYNFVAALDQ